MQGRVCDVTTKIEDCQLLAEFLGVLSHPVRIQMLCALQRQEKTVSELAEYADVSMSNASQHLRSLRDKGIVRTHRSGQHVIYTIVDQRFLEGISLIREAMLEQARRQAEQAVFLSRTSLSENEES